jgi:hypothetical protein
MLQSILVALTLLAIGWCMWTRRQTWHMRWDRALTLAVVLQGVGLALCIPMPGCYLGRALFAVTGIAHLRDYFGHLCFLAATASLMFGVASRLLPDDQIERFMRRIEYPIAVAAAAMLTCATMSRSLRHRPSSTDFFQVIPRDGWLTAYWLTYAAAGGYLLYYLADLLCILREDPRNRFIATVYIAAVRVGAVAVIAIAINAISAGIPSLWIWVPLCLSSGIATFTAGLSWRRRRRAAARPAKDFAHHVSSSSE